MFDADLIHALTYRVPHNTAVVLRGTTVLGIACGVVGSFLMLRKRSLVADALSHAALPGVALAFLLAAWIGSVARWGVDARSFAILIPGATIAGALGVWCVQGLSRLPRVKEDAAIGIVLSVFFAIGVVLLGIVQRTPTGHAAGLNQFIFGQAATMSAGDANMIALVALIVVGIAVLLYKELKALCFDPQFVGGLGWSTLALDGLLLGLITALTMIGLAAVGALLMVALLIIPPAAARFWTDRLTPMLVLAGLIGGLSCHIGAAYSATFSHLPTGPAIVAACGAWFVVSMIAAPRRGVISAVVQRWMLARRVARQHLLRAVYEQAELTGNPRAAVPVAALFKRRAWTERTLMHSLRDARRRREIQSVNGTVALTESGLSAAATIVRTHRIWEHFLTTQADIAPSHVDRAADDIEHVLSEELIQNLERELRERGALVAGEFVPQSPHALAAKGATR